MPDTTTVSADGLDRRHLLGTELDWESAGALTAEAAVPPAASPKAPEATAIPRETAATAAIELELLGGFELRERGVTVELPLSAQRLIAFVALHPRRLRRAFVAGSLWMDVPENRAHANLRTAVWRATRGARLLKANATHVSVADDARIDVRDLARLAREELERPARDEPASDTAALIHADRELLPDWYDDWVLLERERLRHQRLHALESLAVRLREHGRHAAAVDAALAAVAGEPLRETAHRALLAAHLAEGNVAEAIRGYRRFAALLHAELGIAPSPQLDALFADIGGAPVTLR